MAPAPNCPQHVRHSFTGWRTSKHADAKGRETTLIKCYVLRQGAGTTFPEEYVSLPTRRPEDSFSGAVFLHLALSVFRVCANTHTFLLHVSRTFSTSDIDCRGCAVHAGCCADERAKVIVPRVLHYVAWLFHHHAPPPSRRRSQEFPKLHLASQRGQALARK
jgi:hypothetical protein